MNVFLFSCHLIQQVWPARKKIPLSEEKGFYSIFGLAEREMKMIVNKGREGSSMLFRGLSVKHCYSGQQSFFQNVKSFFLKNPASVKWKASMEIKHFLKTRHLYWSGQLTKGLKDILFGFCKRTGCTPPSPLFIRSQILNLHKPHSSIKF